MDSKKQITENLNLEKLSNAEIYYTISNLMGLGGLRDDMIESEKLFVSFDGPINGVEEIRFFFMSMLPIISDTMEEPETYFAIGKITHNFEIELTSGSVPLSVLDPFKEEFDAHKIALLERSTTQLQYPLQFATGIKSIIDKEHFNSRESNDLFQSTWSHIDTRLVKSFDFGRIGNTNYSGSYFMIVKPCEEEHYANSVIDYILIENDESQKIQTFSWQLKANMIEEYEKSGVDCFNNNEIDIARRLFKSVANCNEEKIKELTEGMTEEEFVSSRVKVYKSEYNTAIKAGYNESGANEIAFQEAFGDLISE